MSLALSTDDEIIIIDPESEYRPLVRRAGRSGHQYFPPHHPTISTPWISSKRYGDGENPVVLKFEFLLSLCEQLLIGREAVAQGKVHH